MHVGAPCVCSAQGGQKVVSLQTVVSHHVGAGNRTQDLFKCSKFSYPLSGLSSLTLTGAEER
jgi:hypothetical protein